MRIPVLALVSGLSLVIGFTPIIAAQTEPPAAKRVASALRTTIPSRPSE